MAETLRKLQERLIKKFLDLIILYKLTETALSGYDVITFLNRKYRLLLSSGTVYSLLYSLERQGLIVGTWKGKKRVYHLTEKGKRTIETVMGADIRIKNLNSLLF